jgi:hypothetical protein
MPMQSPVFLRLCPGRCARAGHGSLREGLPSASLSARGARAHHLPQGTLLWGSARKAADTEMSSVLTSVNLDGLSLEAGRLVGPPGAPKDLTGAVLQGQASDGQPVEVALCGAEPDREDPTQVWYRIQIWNEVSGSWESPCIATGRVTSPRALAVQGVWDETGTRREVSGKFTFACENGAIAKCVDWGYKPWAQKDGRPWRSCTRHARGWRGPTIAAMGAVTPGGTLPSTSTMASRCSRARRVLGDLGCSAGFLRGSLECRRRRLPGAYARRALADAGCGRVSPCASQGA